MTGQKLRRSSSSHSGCQRDSFKKYTSKLMLQLFWDVLRPFPFGAVSAAMSPLDLPCNWVAAQCTTPRADGSGEEQMRNGASRRDIFFPKALCAGPRWFLCLAQYHLVYPTRRGSSTRILPISRVGCMRQKCPFDPLPSCTHNKPKHNLATKYRCWLTAGKIWAFWWIYLGKTEDKFWSKPS